MFLEILTCAGSFFAGFIPPSDLTGFDLTGSDLNLFKFITRFGMVCVLCVPLALLSLPNKQAKKSVV
jgi:hypothetical protein